MKVLILSHQFYPFSLVGAKRMTALTRYLLSCGDDITVLKADNRVYGSNIDNENPIEERVKIFNIELERKPISKYLEGFYYLKQYKKCIDHISDINSYDICLMSGYPFEYFLVGPYIKKKYGVKYCLDFRDTAARASVSSLYNIPTLTRKIKNKLNFCRFFYLEWKSIRQADKVILTTVAMKELYACRFPKYAKKMDVVYNGYDDNAVKAVHIGEPDISVMTIGIFGKFGFYSNENTNSFCLAVKRFAEVTSVPTKVRQIGIFDQILSTQLGSIYEYVENNGYISGLNLLQNNWVMAGSHYMKEAIGTKFFDYIYLNRPIIAILPKDSSGIELLKQFEGAYIADCEEQIYDALIDIWYSKRKKLSEHVDKLQKYGRTYQNSKYREILIKASVD